MSGGLPKWLEKAVFGRMCSTVWRFLRHGMLNLLELF
jgi:hypothetical protein